MKNNGFGVGALVVGVVGLMLSFIPVVGAFSIVLTALAIGLAYAGFRRARDIEYPRGTSIAGLTLGVVGTLIAAVQIVVVVFLGNVIGNVIESLQGTTSDQQTSGEVQMEHHENIQEETPMGTHAIPAEYVYTATTEDSTGASILYADKQNPTEFKDTFRDTDDMDGTEFYNPYAVVNANDGISTVTCTVTRGKEVVLQNTGEGTAYCAED